MDAGRRADQDADGRTRRGQRPTGRGGHGRGATVLSVARGSARPSWPRRSGPGRARSRWRQRPRVKVLSTGDELREPGESLGPGEIHNSNGPMLAGLAEHAGAATTDLPRSPTTRRPPRIGLRAALDEAEVVIVAGGVSVGPHDHVKPALARLGVVEELLGCLASAGQAHLVRDVGGSARVRAPRQPGVRRGHIRPVRGPGHRRASGRLRVAGPKPARRRAGNARQAELAASRRCASAWRTGRARWWRFPTGPRART